MSTKTGIEWTDATWNPIRGCSPVSSGCKNCYASKVAKRFSGPGQPYEGLVRINAAGERTDEWNGQVRFVEKHLLDPLKWGGVTLNGDEEIVNGHKLRVFGSRPRRIFVNSMSDLFHENVSDEVIDKIFAVMALCPQHTFQVLTKRPERMLRYMAEMDHGLRHKLRCGFVGNLTVVDKKRSILPEGSLIPENPLPNVWLGVSVENQATADERIPLLLQTPAAVRFISAEPLLGLVDLERIPAPEDSAWHFNALEAGDIYYDGKPGEPGDISDGPERPGLDWVIVGGESGPGARPFNTEWAESIVAQCQEASVACFVKQLGANVIQGGERRIKRDKKGGDWHEWPHELRVREFPGGPGNSCSMKGRP